MKHNPNGCSAGNDSGDVCLPNFTDASFPYGRSDMFCPVHGSGSGMFPYAISTTVRLSVPPVPVVPVRLCRNLVADRLSSNCKSCGRPMWKDHVAHGFFSKQAEKMISWNSTTGAKQFEGSFAMLTPDGGVVRVTGFTHDIAGDAYAWSDKRYIGEVVNGTQHDYNHLTLLELPETKPAPLVLGDTCPKCKHLVKERELFTGTFVGCMC